MKLFIVGIGGKMGHAVIEAAAHSADTVTGGLDRVPHAAFPTFSSANEVNVPIDVIIDFSRPETLPDILSLCRKYSCGCVLATTGYTESEQAKIAELSRSVPVFQSANMSLGVNALAYLAQKAAAMLKGFDIEIIERHHNQKADAPSGTAKLLCDAVQRALPYTPRYVYGRNGITGKRDPHEIGVHAVRGGSIVGEHEVCFCGADEVVTLSHSAGSRRIFAEGALQAAHFIADKRPGLFDMRDMMSDLL